MKNIIFAAAFIAPLILMAGCVSLYDGTEQVITFHLQPKEIQCVASRNGKDIAAITSEYNTIRLTKSRNDLVVLCDAPGYQRQTLNLRSETQVRGVVSGFFTDLGVTDMTTGAMWRYPDEATISLNRQ